MPKKPATRQKRQYMAEIKGLDLYRLSHQWRTRATRKSAIAVNNPMRDITIHRARFPLDCAEGDEELFEPLSGTAGEVGFAVTVGVGTTFVGDGDGVKVL